MKKQLANSFAARIGMTGAIASVMLFATPVIAQDSRLSLADRVAQLEQQSQNKDQNGIGMVNQMQQLQAQVQQLQGQIEELQHSQQQLDDKNKAQFADSDARLQRLESAGAAAPARPASAPAAPPNSPPVAAAAAAGAAAPTAPAPANSPGAAADYDVAFKAIRAGDYVSASRDFRGFIQKYPSDALTPNAFYWLGESYYATMNYPVALEAFQHMLTQFPQSEKAPDALLKVGYCQLELKQISQAKATLTLVGSKYPGSKAASLAQERLRQIKQSSAR